MAGLSKEGLEIKRQIEVIQDLKEAATPIFQDLVPVGDIVDTSDSSTLGRLIGLYSDPLSDLWELSQAVYNAFDPDSATGTSLDDIVAYGGLIRFRESFTKADVYVTGNVGTELYPWHTARSSTTGTTFNIVDPVSLTAERSHGIGVVVSDVYPNYEYRILYRAVANSEFLYVSYTTEASPSIDGMIDEFVDKINESNELKAYEKDGRIWVQGKVDFSLLEWQVTSGLEVDKIIGVAKVQADKVGAIVQAPNTIDRIATPSFGWDSVNNPISASTGSLEETDEELRIRFSGSKAIRATNIIESLYASLLAVDGVEDVVIYENVEDYTDNLGLPPHSFLTIVDGGVESEVARAIWLNRPAGIRDTGTTSIDIVDSQGYTREVRFSRPIPLDVYINLSLTKFSDYPQNGDQRIKEELVEFVNNLATGENLVYSRLYTPINRVQGHQVDDLTISVDGVVFNKDNINTGIDQKPFLNSVNINIT